MKRERRNLDFCVFFFNIRAIIPTLVQNGVAAITVGVNGGSMPPSVPSAFVWKNENTNDSVLGLWHPGGYGGQVVSVEKIQIFLSTFVCVHDRTECLLATS